MKIFFFGAPYFSKEILKYLLKNDIIIDTVITHPDQPVGRKRELTSTELKNFSQEKNIKIKEFAKLDYSALTFLKKEKPDLFIVAAYGNIVPKNILEIPKIGTLNVHPSLLPKFRGASPIQTALLKGVKETGTTIMLMNEKMDSGNIISQSKVQLKTDEKYPELEEKLIVLSAKLLIKVLKDIQKNNWLPRSVTQNDKLATYTRIINKRDGLIDWNKSAQEIYDMWRAFYVWPQIYSFYKNQKIILKKISIYPEKKLKVETNKNGVVLKNQQDIVVSTKNGFIKIERIQLAGKKELTITDFINGHQDFISSQLK